MKYLDFLFWSYYCFCERHKRFYFGDNIEQAIGMMYGSIALPIATIYATIHTFIYHLPMIEPGHWETILLALVLSSPLFFLLDHRYYKNKTITNNNFQIFRERWGDDPRKETKGRIFVIIYTIVSVPICLAICIIVGEMKRRGLIDATPLFPR